MRRSVSIRRPSMKCAGARATAVSVAAGDQVHRAPIAHVHLLAERVQRAELDDLVAELEFRLGARQTVERRFAAVELQFAARRGHAQRVLDGEAVGARLERRHESPVLAVLLKHDGRLAGALDLQARDLLRADRREWRAGLRFLLLAMVEEKRCQRGDNRQQCEIDQPAPAQARRLRFAGLGCRFGMSGHGHQRRRRRSQMPAPLATKASGSRIRNTPAMPACAARESVRPRSRAVCTGMLT